MPRCLLLPVPLCGPGDPRHLRTARGMMAYHLALGAGHSGLAELLHPDIPYTFIFSNDDLQVCCVCEGEMGLGDSWAVGCSTRVH